MPRSVVAVDCEYTEVLGGASCCRLHRTLARWHATAALLDRGLVTNVRKVSGTDTAGWWRSLAWLLARGGVTWIISCPASRVMSLLGLWEGIEHGNVSIVGHDARNGSVCSSPVSTVPGSAAHALPRSGGAANGVLPPVQLPEGGQSEVVGRRHGTCRQGSERGYIVLEDPPTVIHARVSGTTGTIHWVDSRNYGVDVAEPEHTAAERAHKLYDFAVGMISTLRSRQLGGLKDTAGSQAMSSFRRRHLKSIIVCHTDREALQLEGRAYYGGRSEAYRLGAISGPVHHYDYRSLYPSVCASVELPVRLRHVSSEYVDGSRASSDPLDRCIADVTLETTVPNYPVRSGAIVVYPVGRFRTCLAGPELMYAQNRGHIAAWHALAEYDLEPALRPYALEMDAIRKEAEERGDKHLASWAKALGVCLPGKLGQRSRRWETWGRWCGNGPYAEWSKLCPGGKVERWRTVAGITQVEVVESWSHDSVPSMAAWITSAARVRLLEAIRRAGPEHVYYVDTDSLFVDEIGSRRLRQSDLFGEGTMGRLRLEAVYSDMEIRGIKDYSCDGKHVSAGLPKGHKDQPGSSNDYWWTPWIGLATSTHVRPTADAILRHYNRLQPYRHGTVLSGGKVVPLQRWE